MNRVNEKLQAVTKIHNFRMCNYSVNYNKIALAIFSMENQQLELRCDR